VDRTIWRSRQTAFKTPEGEAAFTAAYDNAMKLWPVAYEERDIPTVDARICEFLDETRHEVPERSVA